MPYFHFLVDRTHLCFAKQDFQTIKELGQWASQAECHDSLQHHSQLDTHTELHLRPKFHMSSKQFLNYRSSNFFFFFC